MAARAVSADLGAAQRRRAGLHDLSQRPSGERLAPPYDSEGQSEVDCVRAVALGHPPGICGRSWNIRRPREPRGACSA
jgi:hypothetical protein